MVRKSIKKEQRQRLAIVRVRGLTGVNPDARKTMHLLKLYRKNYCVIVENSDNYIGMLTRIKDFVTFGELDQETFSHLLEKRGRLPAGKPVTPEYIKEKSKTGFEEFVTKFMNFEINIKDVPGLKRFFRLNPPRGGFERKGIKKAYSVGGVLGYRVKEINKLIERML
jgi:large subunit ribosomal protein L30